MKGLYIHVPFCSSKCKYCDFYSFAPNKPQMDSYLTAVLSALEKNSENIRGSFDTIYFGGGTPSFFGGERIGKIIEKAKECFSFCNDTEITVECNPSSVDEKLVGELKKYGVNRISMGLQSALDEERGIIGRKSTAEEVKKGVELFKKYGIDNISVDLMSGLPRQTMESFKKSVDFVLSLEIKHISSYMLKIEEGTPLYTEQSSLSFPDEDTVCDMYLYLSERLTKEGFVHYEISNFAKKDYESRHNTKYWLSEEYLGIGPSAHSYIDGKRFYYERDFEAFLKGAEPVFDSYGGDEEEYIMLRLRLREGLSFKAFYEKYKKELPEEIKRKALFYKGKGLCEVDEEKISLTPEGFLLSNSIIAELLESVEC